MLLLVDIFIHERTALLSCTLHKVLLHVPLITLLSPINTSIAPETLSKALHFSTKIHSFGRNALPRLGSAQLLNIIPDYSIPRDLLPRRHFLFCVHTLRLPSLCRPPHPYTIQVGVQCVFALQKIMQFVSVAFTPDPPYCFY